MERKKIICLFLFVFVFALSSCRPRHVSDIKVNMTKEEVISLWGKTPLVTNKTADGKTVETWEYHFMSSNTACSITFSQDRVVNTRCEPLRARDYGYYSYSGQPGPGTPRVQQKLIREGFFALRLAEAMKLGEFKNEAEAESKLASVGVLPKNGWIADYPLTPKVVTELEHAIAEAADSGKLTMKKDEALNVFRNLIAHIENEIVQAEPLREEQPDSEGYGSPRFYYYPYAYPYPYSFGYYRFYYTPYFRHWR